MAGDVLFDGGPVDVLVVGSGVAGLCAAIEAAEAGVRVVVCESATTPGGASVMSGAACCLVDTPLQRALGITDSVLLALSDWLAVGGPTADAAWAEHYLVHCRDDVHDYCEALGIRWVSVGRSEGNSVPRWHTPEGNGRAIMSALTTRCGELGVSIRLERPLLSIGLSVGTDAGGVQSVRLGGPRGEHEVPVRAVVVASGGFVGNHAMVLERARPLRSLPRLLSGGSPGALGAGHGPLAAVGADFANLDHIWVYPNGTPDPLDPSGRRGLGVRGLVGDVWLNNDGRRFHNESLRGGNSGTAALLRQPGQTAWSVFPAAEVNQLLLIDNEHYGTPADGPHPQAMAQFWRESAYAWRADGPHELAERIGLPVDSVAASLNAVNDDIATGVAFDGAFGRDLAGVAPLIGPVAALQFFPMAQKNFGGVRTDLEGRVLSTDGTAIPGLYAAGEVAGMAGGGINGRAALEGTMFGPSLYSGRVAGKYAAADLMVSA